MTRIISLIIALLIVSHSYSQNIAQWRGAARNGVYHEKDLLKQWPDSGPQLIWFVDSIGAGYSSATVVDNMVFVSGMKDSSDYISAFDKSGKRKWQRRVGQSWTYSFPGTRATPTIDNGWLYMISGKGELVCLDANTGGLNWELDAFNKFEGYCTMWGVSESPLIVDDKLIYTPGGMKTTMVALDKRNGNTLWQTESLKDSTAYVSPVLIDYNGKKIISSITANYFFGVNAENGEVLWKYKYTDLKWRQTHWYSPIINCNTPLYHNGKIFITKGYNHKSAMFALENGGRDIKLLWTDTILDVHFGGAVLINDCIYGSNWINNRAGNWCSLDWNTGKINYEKEWECKGSIITADSLLYCFEEKRGNVALVKPSKKDFNIISQFKIDKGKGPFWAHPSIYGGTLYIRHGNYLLAYDIKGK